MAALRYDWVHLALILSLLALDLHAQIRSTRSADDVVSSIASDCPRSAIAVRDGQPTEVAAKHLVPGDIVHISQVDHVSSVHEIALTVT